MKYLPEATGGGKSFIWSGEVMVAKDPTQIVKLSEVMTEDEYKRAIRKVNDSLRSRGFFNDSIKP